MKEKEVKKPRRFINENGQYCIVPKQKGGFTKFIETYVEIPPYAIDKETGEILNKTNKPILVKGEDFNFYEKIQSYRDDCNIYSILAKYAMTGDESVLNKKVGTFADIVDIPDNINDFVHGMDEKQKRLSKLSVKDQKVILDGNSNQVSDLVQKLVKEELVNKGILKAEKKEGEVNEE